MKVSHSLRPSRRRLLDISIVAGLAVICCLPSGVAQTWEQVATSRQRLTKRTKSQDKMFFGSFGAPTLNDNKNVAFFSTAYGPKVERTNNGTICVIKRGRPALIARENVAVKGGTVYATLTEVARINRSGRIAWAGDATIERATPKGKSVAMPGPGADTEDFAINAKGKISYASAAAGEVYRVTPKAALAIVGVGEVPIGMPLGTTYDSFGGAMIDDQDYLYYVADISDSGSLFDGIWYGKDGDPAPLVTAGQESPGGSAFTTFASPAVPNPNGLQCAFAANTGTGTANTGVWLVDVATREVTEVATTSTRVDDGALANFEPAALNNNGTVAFVATTSGRRGLFAGKPGSLKRIVEVGMTVDADGSSKRVIDFRFTPIGGLNNSDDIAFTASFSDRTSGIFITRP